MLSQGVLDRSNQRINERAHIYYGYIASILSSASFMDMRHPKSVFIFLLNKYLSNSQAIQCESNRKLAHKMRAFWADKNLFTNKYVDTRYLVSVIAVLNKRYAEIEESDDFLPMLHVFFSIYTRYQVHLNGKLQAKIQVIDTFRVYSDQIIDGDIRPLLNKPDLFGNDLALIRHGLGKSSIAKLPSDFINRLLTLINDSCFAAAEILIYYPDKIPDNMYVVIKNKIHEMIRQDDSDFLKVMACRLLGALHAYILMPNDRENFIRFLSVSLGSCNGRLRSDAFNAIIKFYPYHNEMSPETIRKVVQYKCDYILNNHDCVSSHHDDLINFYMITDDACTQTHVRSSLREYSDKCESKQPNYHLTRYSIWPIWDTHEQNEILSRLLDGINSQNFRNVSSAYYKLKHLTSNGYSLEAIHDELVTIMCGNIINQTTINVAPMFNLLTLLSLNLTDKNQQKIVEALLTSFEKSGKPSLFVGNFILAKLNHMLTHEQRSLLISNTLHELQQPVCNDSDLEVLTVKAISELYSHLSKKQIQITVSMLLNKFIGYASDVSLASIESLQTLFPYMDINQRREALWTFFNEIIKDGLLYTKQTIDLMRSHLLDLNYSELIYMMTSLQQKPYKRNSEHMLYLSLYHASTATPAQALLERLPNVSLPREVAREITSHFIR